MVRFNKRLLFAAMPKTASSFVIKAIEQASDLRVVSDRIAKHLTEDMYLYDLEHNTTFTVVRDPADWLVSFWRHCNRGDKPQPIPGPTTVLAPYLRLPLIEFVYEVASRPGLLDSVYGAYTQPSQYVLETRSIRTELCEMLSHLNIDYCKLSIYDMPRINVRPGSAPVVGENLRRLIAENNPKLLNIIKTL